VVHALRVVGGQRDPGEGQKSLCDCRQQALTIIRGEAGVKLEGTFQVSGPVDAGVKPVGAGSAPALYSHQHKSRVWHMMPCMQRAVAAQVITLLCSRAEAARGPGTPAGRL